MRKNSFQMVQLNVYYSNFPINSILGYVLWLDYLHSDVCNRILGDCAVSFLWSEKQGPAVAWYIHDSCFWCILLACALFQESIFGLPFLRCDLCFFIAFSVSNVLLVYKIAYRWIRFQPWQPENVLTGIATKFCYRPCFYPDEFFGEDGISSFILIPIRGSQKSLWFIYHSTHCFCCQSNCIRDSNFYFHSLGPETCNSIQ